MKKKTAKKTKKKKITPVEIPCFIPRAMFILEIHEVRYARIANDLSAELRFKWSEVFLQLAFAIYDHSEDLYEDALMELHSVDEETTEYFNEKDNQ